jgi:hypothetical protein
MKISSSTTFVIWVCALAAAYVWVTYKTTAPFGEFATALTGGAAAYWAKRTYQKRYDCQAREGPGTDGPGVEVKP